MKKLLPLLALSALLVACGPRAATEGADSPNAPTGAEKETGRQSEGFNPSDAEKSLMDVAETFLSEFPQGQITEIEYEADTGRFVVEGVMGEKEVSIEMPATGTKIVSKEEEREGDAAEAPVLDVGPLAEWKEAVERAQEERPEAPFEGFELHRKGEKTVYEMEFEEADDLKMDAESLAILSDS